MLPAPEPSLLFVYGSLQRGQLNHPWLADAPCLGRACLEGLQLHDLGPFPMAIVGEGRLHGELYRVGAPLLARLDRFEGVPRLYERCRWPLADGRAVWVYLGRPRQVRHSPRLQQGIWPASPQPYGSPSPSGPRPGGRRRDRSPVPGTERRDPERSVAGVRAVVRAVRLAQALVLPLLSQMAGLVAVPMVTLMPRAVDAAVDPALCQRWQSSSGEAYRRLGNAIGATAYLTKVQRFAISDDTAPVLLYAPSDLWRICNSWR